MFGRKKKDKDMHRHGKDIPMKPDDSDKPKKPEKATPKPVLNKDAKIISPPSDIKAPEPDPKRVKEEPIQPYPHSPAT